MSTPAGRCTRTDFGGEITRVDYSKAVRKKDYRVDLPLHILPTVTEASCFKQSIDLERNARVRPGRPLISQAMSGELNDLGQHMTPPWIATEMCRQIQRPVREWRVFDPACG